MTDDYLWDRSGEPDPEVQRLERLLGGLGYQRPAPNFQLSPVKSNRPRFGPRWISFAAAATILLALGGWWVIMRTSRSSWEVDRLDGRPKVGSRHIESSGSLAVGELLETDRSSRAMISIGRIGRVQVEPNSRVRLVQARLTEHRLALDRGSLQASIWAPPRLFFVDTPSAVAVDLGCAYILQVDESGASLLHVTYGWVAFELNGRESFVPAEALCATRPGMGPGTPYFEDSSPAFRSALVDLDFGNLAPQARDEALGIVLTEARTRDAFTLWHLLARLAGEDRARVYDRMAELVHPPQGVTRQGVLHGDKQMLDLWWDQLGLKDTSWWRLWKGPSPLGEK